jgi:hypothetical protein
MVFPECMEFGANGISEVVFWVVFFAIGGTIYAWFRSLL